MSHLSIRRRLSHLQHRLHGRRRVFVAAQVDDDPGDVAQEGDGDGRVDKGQQWLDHTHGDDVVPAVRAVACGWRTGGIRHRRTGSTSATDTNPARRRL